jgi:hypothetical protein
MIAFARPRSTTPTTPGAFVVFGSARRNPAVSWSDRVSSIKDAFVSLANSFTISPAAARITQVPK